MHSVPSRQLEPQEAASVAALAFHFGLVETADVVDWAVSCQMSRVMNTSLVREFEWR
jgi:hypothetical protein